ncbi:integrase family protein [Ammonifex degensii KC4]|uniref:Integrase family protein n=1 Tax=Ammonifex degensii (strain DSM 10501 / KC4) TaxID=429009 RepID=C9R9U3_AMMDK|nr:tyrosine-type recombinase/integrase [Ammonifex degensii]ACX53072.1 integrase family protein [Ammonifex degensii KC4]
MRKLFRLSERLQSTWQEVLEEFCLHQQAQGKAERTLYDYRAWIGRFFRRHPDAWGDYERLRRAVLEHFAHLSHKAPATFNMARKYLKLFFAWCVREGYLPANPVDGIKKRREDGTPRPVSLEAVQKLLTACDRKSFTGLRDYALILFQLDTGVRPGEALKLLPEHFNLRSLEVYIPAQVSKTRAARTVVISPQTARAVQRLLAVRPAAWGSKAPVFCSETGQPMQVSSWTHRLALISRRAGVKVTPYQLRHTAATELLRGGASAFAVARQLGHLHLSTTRRYIQLVEEDLRREHDRASPVARLVPERVRAPRRLD